MATLLVYDAVGDPKTLLAGFEAAGKELKGELPAGTLAHICVPTGTGIRTYVLLESDSSAREDFAGSFAKGRDAVHRHGLVTKERHVQMLPVHSFSVATDVHDKAAKAESDRNGGGTGPASKVAVIGELEEKEA